MKAVVFDLKGSIAHFRRPDTTATHLTYPFITPTAAKGVVGSILGITDFVTHDRVGIQLLRPVRTSAQQMSMLGKIPDSSFNRPTTIELLVNPAYRIYYVGDEHTRELADKLEGGASVYHTYLGVAFALSFPQFIQFEEQVCDLGEEEVIETPSVVPTSMIQDLILEETRSYSRAGGFMKEYLGNRRFEKSVSFIYEKDGQPITFRKKNDEQEESRIVQVGEIPVCLV